MSFFKGIVASFRKSIARKTSTPARIGIESLEEKRLLASDLAVTSFAADGEDLVVQYDVLNQSASAFDIAVFRSSNGTTKDAELARVRVTDSALLSQGVGHEVSIDAVFTDVQEDYFLLVELDVDGEVAESSESNNEMLFEGGIFQTSDDTVHVHGTSGADDIFLLDQGTDVEVSIGSESYSFSKADVAAIHVRSHEGDDYVSADLSLDKDMVVFAGDGSDTVEGGDGDDYIDGQDGDDDVYSGGGDDTIYGGTGDDWLFGEDGADNIYGEEGSDSLYGGDGNDRIEAGNNAADGDYIYGEGGDDTLIGSDRDDTIWADDGDDTLLGGGGDDILYGGSGTDYMEGGGGDDNMYGEEDADELYGGLGDDYVDGGDGVDTYVFAGNQAGDTTADRPAIQNFHGTAGATNTWKFTGSISDDADPAGLTVTFGGVIPASTTTTVKPDGTFEVIVVFNDPPVGIATAVFTDDENLTSEVATFSIS